MYIGRDQLIPVFITLIFFAVMYYLDRHNRRLRQIKKKDPLVKLEQLTHPDMKISGNGDFFIAFDKLIDGKIVHHKHYYPTLWWQENGIKYAREDKDILNLEHGLRGNGEWEKW